MNRRKKLISSGTGLVNVWLGQTPVGNTFRRLIYTYLGTVKEWKRTYETGKEVNLSLEEMINKSWWGQKF